MTNKSFDIDDGVLEGFTGVEVGAEEGRRFVFPGIGYKAQDGKFFIDQEPGDRLVFTPLAMRQCKTVLTADGVLHRYPIYTRKVDMVAGVEERTRMQVLMVVAGSVYIFGSYRWTPRALFLNPMEGMPHHDPDYPGGIWPRLTAHIREMKKTRGIALAPLCYRLTLVAGNPFTKTSKANPRNASTVYPATVSEVVILSPEEIRDNEALYRDLEVTEWVKEWGVAGTEEPSEHEDDSGSALPASEGIPF